MIKFVILTTNEEKTAFSIKDKGNYYLVFFTQEGKPYSYSKNRIKIISEEEITKENSSEKEENLPPFILYTIPKQCWKCGNEVDLLTYITFSDGTKESVTFPWDKPRLLKNQNILAHMLDGRNGAIEYYGMHVLGDIYEFDDLLMQKFPDRIQKRYSKTVKMTYPMNICPHCDAIQGKFFLFEIVDNHIKHMQPIKTLDF